MWPASSGEVFDMKSMLSPISLTFGTPALGGFNLGAFKRAGLGVVVCLAIPWTAAYAQDWAGTVNCVETHPTELAGGDFDYPYFSIATEYSVTSEGRAIVGRWGEGNDVIVGSGLSISRPGVSVEEPLDIVDLFKNVTDTFWTIPKSRWAGYVDPAIDDCGTDQICLQEEEVYSETGSLKYAIRNDELTVRGTSFVIMEFPLVEGWTEMTAECTWNLTAPLDSF